MKEIEIDDDKYSLLSDRANEKGFESTEEYVHHLLDQIIEKIKAERSNKSSEEEEAEVKKKLEKLGYKN